MRAKTKKIADKPVSNIAVVRRSYLLSLNCGHRFIHNSGTRYANGKLCSDCGRFIKKGTLEYFMTSGILDIWLAIYNRSVKFRRGEIEKDLDIEVKKLREKLDNREELLKMTEDDAKIFMDETYKILSNHKILDNEACKTLY